MGVWSLVTLSVTVTSVADTVDSGRPTARLIRGSKLPLPDGEEIEDQSLKGLTLFVEIVVSTPTNNVVRLVTEPPFVVERVPL